MAYLSYEVDGRARLGVIEGSRVRGLAGISELNSTLNLSMLEGAERDEYAVPVANVRRLPASPRPGKIFCVGLNYDEHIAETGREKPTYPVLFPKFASNLIGPDDAIQLPSESEQVDFEGELAVIIGNPGRRIRESAAIDHVLGFAVANDITMRDYQYKTHQWLQGKAWDRSTPLDATIVTPSEVNISTVGIRTVVNGKTMQESSVDHLIFSIPRLIEVISTFTELECGDVIMTGTPGGVGYRRDPQVFLKNEDEVTVEIDGVGRLTNHGRSEHS